MAVAACTDGYSWEARGTQLEERDPRELNWTKHSIFFELPY